MLVRARVWVNPRSATYSTPERVDVLEEGHLGLPKVNGLSTKQWKRLTSEVELIASPSIIFMDKTTSRLDARAAATMMKTVRNTVDTDKTVVCTIHQPRIDIFKAFDNVRIHRTSYNDKKFL